MSFQLVQAEGAAAWIEVLRIAMSQIGIDLAHDPASVAPELASASAAPSDRLALNVGADVAWRADYPNASTFFVSLFTGSRIVAVPGFRILPANFSLVGATSDDLRTWGYGVTHMLSIDARVERCLPMIGGAQAACWAELDQYVMEVVVPVVPILFDDSVRIVSDRVRTYSMDQFTAMPALDRIALAPEGG